VGDFINRTNSRKDKVMTEQEHENYKERVGELLEGMDISPDDMRTLLEKATVSFDEMPADVLEANPFYKWWASLPELADCRGGLINWRKLCNLLEGWKVGSVDVAEETNE